VIVVEEEEDKELFVKCPRCGRILEACAHVSHDDIATIKRLLKAGIIVYESEEDMLEDEVLGHEEESVEPKADLYQYLVPRFQLSDVVLSERARESLEDVLIELKNKKTIYDRWGLARVVRKRKGLSLMFAGSPGTGKTMTAEAIANAIGQSLMIVNYAQLENMWVGETEKNIERVFREAAKHRAVLFFDEADAVFYRRGMNQAPWANRDVNILLKHLENFSGVTILATNLTGVMDKALDRRVDIAIEFEFPDVKMREEIYRKTVPREAPLAEGVDFALLAKKYQLSGGSILNVVRQAMRYALRRPPRQRAITMEDFVRAAEREMEKSRMMQKNHLYGTPADQEKKGDHRLYA
jgi:SpoVK/Ycf46/Vps4 family AAA+-type ATPase